MPYNHPFKSVLLKGNTREVKIDIEIFDLIVALNELGWHTDSSCQDNIDERVWISFRSATEAEYFLTFIAKNSLSLHEHVFNATTELHYKDPDAIKYEDAWWVDAFVNTMHWRKRIEERLLINISVRFPREHLEKVTKLVTNYLKGD